MLNISAEPSVKRTARGRRLRIAVTGFGPFPGVPFNASARLVRDIAETASRGVPAPLVTTAVLPTDWRRGLAELRALARELRPDIFLHFGVSSRARGFVIETRAYNQTSGRADCLGALAGGRCVRGNAVGVLRASLPAGRLVQRLRAEGIAATLSADAGRYLCNAVLFESLVLCAGDGARRVGFVHIPPLRPPEDGERLPNGFGWDQLRRGAALILDTLAGEARRRT